MKFLEQLSQRQDMVLAIFLMSIIFMMIIPLPTALVDVLIGISISIAVVLLMVAVYLKEPLDFASFPSVLLITTLFRLALSISTTRLILLQADAGQIVETFGQFVVGGNLIVGLVIFAILTIVNFLVITKGSERVAEVSARFSLDAMPGKQLSIDADLRNGGLTNDEAKAARARIQRESKLFGSMDGAMKFVKGDAIAGLIIVFVNLLGGLAIGTLQNGQTAGEALELYAILTIGDGLISQIPALFISICAGIIVTRVTDDSADAANLGTDISNQLTNEPKALGIGAAMLLVFALIPGFPWPTFLFLAVVLGTPAYLAMRRMSGTKVGGRQEEVAQPLETLVTPQEQQLAQEDFSVTHDDIYSPTVQLLVELSDNIEQDYASFNLTNEINKARLQIYFRLGVSLPGIEVRRGRALPPNFYRIFVTEIPTAQGEIVPGSVLVFDNVKNLELYGIPYIEKDNFIPKVPAIWVEDQYREKMDNASIRYRSPVDVITYHSEFIYAKYVNQFVGIHEIRQVIARTELLYPELVKEVQRIVPIQMMTELFKRLVQEYVSVRDLRSIFGAMVEWGPKEKDPVILTEHIRISLGRQISHQYAANNNVLSAILLDGSIEESIRSSIRQTSTGSYLAMDPEMSKQIVTRIRNGAEPVLANGNPITLITSMDVRRYLRRMIETELPELPVISYQELASDVTLQPVARIS